VFLKAECAGTQFPSPPFYTALHETDTH